MLTLVIDTPQGQITGSVVQRIDWQGATGLYKTATQGVDPSQTSLRVTGEALAVEVAPGRWLFALLKGDQGLAGRAGDERRLRHRRAAWPFCALTRGG